MLYGQSAGGTNTFTISTLPQAPSLISSAIIQSGSGRDLSTIAEVQKFYEFYASQLNCSKTDVSISHLLNSIPHCFLSVAVGRHVRHI